MTPKIWEIPVAVILWTQEGCPACEEYYPKFHRVAQRYAGCLPIIIADINQFPGAADKYRVAATPTTMITRYGERPFFGGFLDGDAPEDRIEHLFGVAVTGLDCAV